MDQTRAITRQIGQRIRDARTIRKLTLQDLGRATDLSAAFLSRIERGEATPSIGNLITIASELEIPLRDLFEAPEEPAPKGYTVVRRSKREPTHEIEAAGYSYHWLSGDLSEPALSAFLIEYPVAESDESNLVAHEGEEVLYLLEGSVEFQIGTDRILLEEGDCLHLFGDKPHMGRNVGTKPARLLMVVTPPSAFGQKRS